MIYLIGQLAGWLVLAAAFAALAGWAYAAQRAAPAEAAMRRDRGKLLRDLTALAVGERTNDDAERDDDPVRRLADINGGRIAELEQALEIARARADDATSRVAELQRNADRHEADLAEWRRLAVQHERDRANEIEVAPEPSQDDAALQAWRLRYFEQRVRYLESQPRAVAAAAPEVDQGLEWRAREAEARAAHLEHELRGHVSAPAGAAESADETTASPFTADAAVDVLLRWRLLYLERRVAHLQAALAPALAPATARFDEAAPDTDRWKWRARYLEARVRHLETQPPAPVRAAVAPRAPDMPPPPAMPRGEQEKPQVLSAPRSGAPDDFTLIEGVSLLQQSTLYSLGIFHFDQIAAWTPANVGWVDQYLRLRGRIEEEEWVEQADELAHEGSTAARRVTDSEDA